MTNEELRELLNQSRDIRYFEKPLYDSGLTYRQVMDKLTYVGTIQAAYGDYSIYRDEDGNLWNSYFSIGD